MIWSGNAIAEEGKSYWNKLKKAANQCFDGIDVDMELSGGYSQIYEDDEWGTRPAATVTVKIPLYSAGERISRREKQIEYLRQGAKVIAEYEAAQAKIGLLKEQIKISEKAMVQEGLDGIEKFYQIKEELAKTKAQKNEAVRTLEGMMEGCK